LIDFVKEHLRVPIKITNCEYLEFNDGSLRTNESSQIMVLENEDLLEQLGPIRDYNAKELENLKLKNIKNYYLENQVVHINISKVSITNIIPTGLTYIGCNHEKCYRKLNINKKLECSKHGEIAKPSHFFFVKLTFKDSTSNDKAIIQVSHAIASMLIQKSAAEIHIISKKDVNIFAFYINNYILNVKNFSLIYY
jgi:type II secretory ATPase GspE/PulE/Tfp pilus assembly ATPase PilB-like protein